MSMLPRKILSLCCIVLFQGSVAIVHNGVHAPAAFAQDIGSINMSAQQFENQGRYEDAIQLFTQALAYAPNTPDFYYNRGRLLAGMARFKEAVSDYNAGLYLEPNSPRFLLLRGVALRSVGEYDQALRDITTAMLADPNDPYALLHRAYLYNMTKKYPEALRDLDRAQSMQDPDFNKSWLHAVRANVYAKMGSLDKVAPECQTALDLYDQVPPNTRGAYGPMLSECADAKARCGDLMGALTLVNEVLANPTINNQGRSRALAVRAIIYGKQNQMSLAEKDASDAIRIAPNYVPVQELAVRGVTEGGSSSTTSTAAATTTPDSTSTAAAPQAVSGANIQNNPSQQQPPAGSQPHTVASAIPSSSPGSSTALASTQNVNRPVDDKWAVVVGVGKFQDRTIPPLKYSTKDARDFAEFLVQKANFKRDHVRLLLDDQATRIRVISELCDKFLPRVTGKNDLVVFYFSGHGSGSAHDVKDANYLICHDSDKGDLYATGIELQELTRQLKRRVGSDRILIVLDACHSGGAGANAKALEPPSNFDANMLAGSGQLVICSSSQDQKSWESKRYNNGVFTKKLMEGLSREGAATKLKSAFQFLEEEVEREVREDEAEKQTPILKSEWDGKDLNLSIIPYKPRPLPETVKSLIGPDSFSPAPVSSDKPSPPTR